MFKRSFSSRDRVGKSAKPAKKTYRDQTKAKLQEKLDNPSSGKFVVISILPVIETEI